MANVKKFGFDIDEVNYPSHNIDPKRKNEKWILQYLKAAFYEGIKNRQNYTMFFNSADRYLENALYARAQQETSKYRGLMDDVVDTKNETWLNINWEPLGIVPKFRRIAVSKILNQKYKADAKLVDPLANKDKEKYEKKIRASIMLAELLQASPNNNIDTEQLFGEGDPRDLEELRIRMDFGWKPQLAIDFQKGINLVLDLNDFEELRSQVAYDIFDFGAGGYRWEFDSDGKIIIRKVNVERVITSYCTKRDFSDIQHFGEILPYTIAELKEEIGTNLSETEYENIAKAYTGKLQNAEIWRDHNAYNKGYDDMKILVFDGMFYSDDTKVFEEGKDKRGNIKVSQAAFNAKGENFRRTKQRAVYRGKWIIGSDIIFNYGKMKDMTPNKANLYDMKMPVALFAPELYEMTARGMLDEMKPIADNIQIAWYNLQNVQAQARPMGLAIEIGSIENIPMGANGETMQPEQVLQLFNKKGHLLYRQIDPSGNMSGAKPIQELSGGIGDQAQAWFQQIQNNIQLLRDITGLNEITDGSTPDPKTLVAVAELSALGTNNALSHINQADLWLQREVMTAVGDNLKVSVKNGPVEGYIRTLGKNTTEWLSVNKEIQNREFGLNIKPVMTEERRQQMMQTIGQVVPPDQMTVEDLIMLNTIEDEEYAMQVMSYRIKQRQAQAQAEAMQMEQLKTQQAMALAEQGEMLKRGTKDHEMAWKEKEIGWETDKAINEFAARAELIENPKKRSDNLTKLMIERGHDAALLAKTVDDNDTKMAVADKQKQAQAAAKTTKPAK